jgi:hypothetical protein
VRLVEVQFLGTDQEFIPGVRIARAPQRTGVPPPTDGPLGGRQRLGRFTPRAERAGISVLRRPTTTWRRAARTGSRPCARRPAHGPAAGQPTRATTNRTTQPCAGSRVQDVERSRGGLGFQVRNDRRLFPGPQFRSTPRGVALQPIIQPAPVAVVSAGTAPPTPTQTHVTTAHHQKTHRGPARRSMADVCAPDALGPSQNPPAHPSNPAGPVATTSPGGTPWTVNLWMHRPHNRTAS